ncbi:hypothetical protein N7509_004678 [Penicillium cosmopolitanum]|uniref:Uncharacterized protein n=1 Tax=Penicillium cosmopolitanum TaxID=1131564 RepID=A0A9W9W0X0_9EURO|nr:uncharacterized protein N7509_004678 [Penicillium cosmopolitanum]KAJ5396565.1 hypothetical protein N7509_004678 [Penicillium cosmopolitanum]
MGIISVMSIMDSSGLHFPRSTEHMYGNPLFLPRIKMFRFERMENKETTAQALQDSYPNLFSDNQLYALLSFQVWNPDDGKVMRMVQPWEKDSLLMRETRTASHGCPDRFPDIFQSPIVVDGDIDHQRVQVVFKTPRTFQVLLDLLDTVIYLN